MFRCNQCGAGIVQWSAGAKWVLECRICSIQWLLNSDELEEWGLQREESFTNKDVL
jgi:hypothetical protein